MREYWTMIAPDARQGADKSCRAAHGPNSWSPLNQWPPPTPPFQRRVQLLELTPFSTKGDNLGELIFTVRSVHVGGWAGVGACLAEGVGGPAGSAGGRLGVDAWSFGPSRRGSQ